MDDISFLSRLLELDYDFQIITKDGNKAVCTKYGTYYLRNMNVDVLFDCIVFFKAKQLLSWEKTEK